MPEAIIFLCSIFDSPLFKFFLKKYVFQHYHVVDYDRRVVSGQETVCPKPTVFKKLVQHPPRYPQQDYCIKKRAKGSSKQGNSSVIPQPREQRIQFNASAYNNKFRQNNVCGNE
jgi:hypothetical protein